jgi:hypothetical protein
MNQEFKVCGAGADWLSWLGQPMIYDGDLCVCRTVADITVRRMHWRASLIV